jgi:hypothetical protein
MRPHALLKFAILPCLIIAIMFLPIGCGNLSLESYNKIKVGMSYDEVTKIIGNPDKVELAYGHKKCTWGNDKRYISVHFLAEKVVYFSNKGLS